MSRGRGLATSSVVAIVIGVIILAMVLYSAYSYYASSRETLNPVKCRQILANQCSLCRLSDGFCKLDGNQTGCAGMLGFLYNPLPDGRFSLDECKKIIDVQSQV